MIRVGRRVVVESRNSFKEGVLCLRERNLTETRWSGSVFSVDVPVEYWSQGRTGSGIKVRLVK